MGHIKSLEDRAYEKIKREFDEFIADLKTKSPTEIIEAAYEITYKEEILNLFEWEGAFNTSQCKAILRAKKPLDMLYQEWNEYDGSVVDTLKDSIVFSLNKEIELHKAKQHIDREGR